MGRRVMSCVVIGKVGDAGLPVDQELAVGGMVTDPVETHVNGLGTALLDSVVG